MIVVLLLFYNWSQFLYLVCWQMWYISCKFPANCKYTILMVITVEIFWFLILCVRFFLSLASQSTKQCNTCIKHNLKCPVCNALIFVFVSSSYFTMCYFVFCYTISPPLSQDIVRTNVCAHMVVYIVIFHKCLKSNKNQTSFNVIFCNSK